MSSSAQWIARAWPPYLVVGVIWVSIGTILSGPQGVGLTFIGLACLCFGVFGA